jgi:hypothetical protein
MTGTARKAVRANIVSWDGGGLGTDIDVLTEALVRAGCEVRFKDVGIAGRATVCTAC